MAKQTNKRLSLWNRFVAQERKKKSGQTLKEVLKNYNKKAWILFKKNNS